MEFDVSEVRALADRLSLAGRQIERDARKVVEQHAIRTKQGMAEDSRSAGRRFAALPSLVDYTLRGLNVEVGWRPGGAGSLAHVAAFGAGYSGPQFDHTAAQERELPATERFLADLGVEVLES